ncbi:hypothetical protein DVV91_12345 [Clostridium botulinum]|uniref:hypothetical protein n=1 Tax=Clostridium botulinum TaxID=1491 RepID=UPI000174E6E0|nr:hypothetical protein [Clostridium botulinum]ACD51854.1 hypothetical protein CLH_2479 [Clostridium botulinum E3 str. Alaska E43]AJF30325.1 hypothetical protein ST13_11675 [Clostridium botulinum]AJF33388.1 hypothetical protein ST12_11675 [Clostridium botulinum]MBN1049408.1 hypothetical protein [Clostridium botulinum]MBN1075129.1 hypothetical protein [Clostridium botulinum]
MAVVKRRAVPKSTPEQLEKYKQEQESKNREVHLEMEEQNQQQKVQQSIENEKSKEEYVLEKFIPSTSKNTNRVNCKKGVVTLVNYQSGKRIIIS